ncbi:zinc-containing alcohol dehydrogenase family protein [Abortiporus biennis]
MSEYPATHTAIGLTSSTSGLTSFRCPTEAPGPNEVLVKVTWAAVVPAENWQIDFQLFIPSYPCSFGEVLTGEVVEVGSGLKDEFKPGDLIASVSVGGINKGRAFQEYAVLEKFMVAKIPPNVAPQDAIAIIDNFTSPYYTLFDPDNIGLPEPTDLPAPTIPAEAEIPILVWGGGGNAGQGFIQVLHITGYKNIIAVSSYRHREYLRSIGAAYTFDYSSETIIEDILEAAGGLPVKYAIDAITDEEKSLRLIAKVVGEGSTVAYFLPVQVKKDGKTDIKLETTVKFPEGTRAIPVAAGFYYKKDNKMKKELQPVLVRKVLEKGLMKPNRIKELDGSNLLEKVLKGMDLLRRGQVSRERLIARVA